MNGYYRDENGNMFYCGIADYRADLPGYDPYNYTERKAANNDEIIDRQKLRKIFINRIQSNK